MKTLMLFVLLIGSGSQVTKFTYYGETVTVSTSYPVMVAQLTLEKWTPSGYVFYQQSEPVPAMGNPIQVSMYVPETLRLRATLTYSDVDGNPHTVTVLIRKNQSVVSK